MRGAWVAPVLLVFCLGACAAATNYADPDEPRYVTRYGRGTLPEETIRVVSFNLKVAEKVDEAIAMFRETPALRRPDILALQEMDAEGTERIARALEMNSIFFPAAIHPKTGRDFGNALLSPWPLKDMRKMILPGESRFSGLKRTATVATVRVGDRPIAGVAEDTHDASDHRPIRVVLEHECGGTRTVPGEAR